MTTLETKILSRLANDDDMSEVGDEDEEGTEEEDEELEEEDENLDY